MCYRISIIALVVLVVCAVAQVEAQEFVTAGLVSFWTFDRDTIDGDTVKDVWGGNDGKMTDTVAAVGMVNEGLEFNGSSSLIDIDEDPSLDITDAMSMDAWIKISVWQADPNRNIIMARYNAGENKRYLQFALNPDNGLATYMGYSNGTAYFQTQKGGQNLDWIDQWVHVAFTWDHSDGGLSKLYVNGEEIGAYANQEPLEEPLVPYDVPWTIGAMAHNSRFFSGVMDEVRIYNRRLSDDEITRNFNARSNIIAVQPAGKLAATWGEAKLSW